MYATNCQVANGVGVLDIRGDGSLFIASPGAALIIDSTSAERRDDYRWLLVVLVMPKRKLIRRGGAGMWLCARDQELLYKWGARVKMSLVGAGYGRG